MHRKRLQVRSWTAVTVAYVAGPLIGLTVLWLVLLPTEFGNSLSIGVLWLILMVGSWISLAVEILVITPLLIAHQRYRWGWLNGWTGTALGFFLGAAPWPLMLFASSDLDTLTALAALDMAWKTGLVGAIAAIVFRLLAVAPVEQPA